MARAIALLAKARTAVPCLPPATGDLPATGGVIVASPASPTRKTIEHAGHVYQETLIRTYAINHSADPDDLFNAHHQRIQSTSPEKSSLSSATGQSSTTQAQEAASKLASKLAVGSEDMYELLELGEKRWHASADDIKKAFRRISLIYHPDKISHLGEEARANSEAHFKAVMKAYDILSDKKKRAAYDSIDDVDDSIPSERDATGSPARFYEKFGACFSLNARWSVSDRVPELGDDDTDINTVNKFYDFWYGFKSWRDFSFNLEHDPDQAECREEKRWMDRQNAKHVKTKKLEENARIRRLVDLSYKYDPRLLRERAAAKAKKDAEKQEKKRVAEEQARGEREEKERAKAAADKMAAEEKVKRAAAKKQKDAARQLMRKSRQKLRGLGRDLGIFGSDKGLLAIENMCSEGTVESIEAVAQLLDQVKGENDSAQQGLEILHEALKNPRTPVCNGDSSSSPTPNGTDSAKNESTGELRSDEKTNGSTNSSATCTADSNGSGSISASSADVNAKKTSQTVWSPDELSFLSKGVAKFPGGTRDRWNRLAEYIGTKTADEILRKVDESRPSKLRPGAATKTMSSKPEESKAFERFQEKKKGKPVVPQKGKAGAPGSQPPNKLCFSPKEQSKFEAALKRFPASQGESRWTKVASVVGRSSDECHERFSELIAFFQAKKQAQS